MKASLLDPANGGARALLAAHATVLVLVAWITLSSVRHELGGGNASAAARAAWRKEGDWEFPLPPELLDRGVIYDGDHAPASRLAQKLLSGQPISVLMLGGSLTFGKGASSMGSTDWVTLFFSWLRSSFPVQGGGDDSSGSGGSGSDDSGSDSGSGSGTVSGGSGSGSHSDGKGGGRQHCLRNEAVAASPSEYISLCLHQHLDPDHPPDLAVVEYAVNDGLRPWHDAHRLSYERLLRRLLQLPSRPLVVGLMMHSYRAVQTNRTFHRSGEEKLGTLQQYYQLPWLSMRSVVHHKLVAEEDGFQQRQWLQFDDTHPNDRGQTYVAQLVIHYLKRLLEREQLQQLKQKALLPRRLARRQALSNPASAPAAAVTAAAALPPPMLPGAWPLVAETCLHSQPLQAAVVNGSMHGFVWTRGGRKEAPEINAFTNTTGSELTVKLSTDVALDVGSGVEAANATHVGVLLWHIHSKYTVGHGQATCGGGCTCEPQLLKTALQSAYGTQDHLWLMMVSRAHDCLITIRTLNTTDTVGHMFRFRGILVSAAAAVRVPGEFRLGENLDAELPLDV